MLKPCLFALALLSSAVWAAPSANWDQPMVPLARIDWSDALNPALVPVGQDRVLFDTRDGVRLWDAQAAEFLPLKAAPGTAASAPERLL
jgi:hypothetical protein